MIDNSNAELIRQGPGQTMSLAGNEPPSPQPTAGGDHAPSLFRNGTLSNGEPLPTGELGTGHPGDLDPTMEGEDDSPLLRNATLLDGEPMSAGEPGPSQPRNLQPALEGESSSSTMGTTTVADREQFPAGDLGQSQPIAEPAEEVAEADLAVQERRFAVVTGASSGIGLELARQLASRGYDLLVASETDSIEPCAEGLRALGAEVTSVCVDLASHDGVEQLCERIRSVGRPIDVLCANAGVGVGGRFTETNLEEEFKMISLNVCGAVHLTKRVLPDMVSRNSGHIMFTSSVAAVMPSPFEAVYGATKAFLLLFSESLASELHETEVKVTAVLPGPTETNFFHRAHMDNTKAGQESKESASRVAERALKAMDAGKEKAYVGDFKNRVMGMLADLLPDEVGADAQRKQAEPIPASQASVR